MVADGAIYMPVEQYLALDNSTDGLYEYWHGLVIMLRSPASVSAQHLVDLAGGSPAHAALAARLASLIDQQLPENGSCIVYSSDVLLKLADDHYLHPDVAIGCTDQTEKVLTQPMVLIEVFAKYRKAGSRFQAIKL